MNLHAVAGPIVAVVNPFVIGDYQRSLGSVTAASGHRAPNFAPPVGVQIQMQALSFKDLTQISGLNQNGERKAMYISGKWEGISRPEARGGDKVTLRACGTVWLVVQVLENWAETDSWTKVAVTRQLS